MGGGESELHFCLLSSRLLKLAKKNFHICCKKIIKKFDSKKGSFSKKYKGEAEGTVSSVSLGPKSKRESKKHNILSPIYYIMAIQKRALTQYG